MDNRNNFYTLEEKLELYIGALDYLRLKALEERYEGFCRVMEVIVATYYAKHPSRIVAFFYGNHLMPRSPFPELLAFKPHELVFSSGEPDGLFWFPLNEEGNNKRVEILKLIIKNLQDGRALYERAEA